MLDNTCPFLSVDGNTMYECKDADCKIYDNLHCVCSFVSISQNLDRISQILERLVYFVENNIRTSS